MGHEWALVHLALKSLSCNQKELALRLGVSPTQITKWKHGEHMSFDMQEKIRAIAGIDDKDPEFVLLAGSLQDAMKWERLIYFLAEQALESAETGYNTYPLTDEDTLLCGNTFHTLHELGVDLPGRFPDQLDINYDSEEAWDLVLNENPYSALIYRIYLSLNDIWGFYAAYVQELTFNETLDPMSPPVCDIEPCLLELAACKLEQPDEKLAPKFKEFRRKVLREYEERLNYLKDAAYRAGLPLRAELLRLVHSSSGELGHEAEAEAEAESMGFNSTRIHPDIYMNELLVGMRVIHQVLPAILKKLGIEKEFQLDESDLHAH